MITENQIVIRVIVAAVLGLLIGLERERRSQDAGLRTHMILVVGAALAMTVSVNIAAQYHPDAPNGDPARLAAQVISGIGFLGAGVIFRSGVNVHGLTTAVSLWTMAIVGLAVGAGFFLTSGVVTALLLVILSVLDYIEDHFITSVDRIHLTVWAEYRPGLLTEVKEVLKQGKQKIGEVTIERDIENSNVVFDVNVAAWKKRTSEAIIDELSAINGIRKVKIKN